MKDKSRRTFVKTTVIAGVGMISGFSSKNSWAIPTVKQLSKLELLSEKLLSEWLNSLIQLQITDILEGISKYGGIIDPAKGIIHGRIGDTIYPMLYLAKQTGDEKYLKSAKLLYQWMGNNVSQDDGSWLNEPVKNSWKGTTVFTIIALTESLNSFGDIIGSEWRKDIEKRLLKAGNYICQIFSIEYGNINYPINAAYALTLLGTLLNNSQFTEKGKSFAKQALQAFTPEGFIAGEGALFNKKSKKGCYAVDLSYNVEESLPALVMYAQLVKDESLLNKLTTLLQTHLEFMLPDGAWDNSWGTRNYKWTYWGSRTTDGCQTAYALMADKDARFYKAALLNTQLLQKSTESGLLYGGLHYTSAGLKPSSHHSFSHAKSLAKILESKLDLQGFDKLDLKIPREEVNRTKLFKDIQTLLVAGANFKATFCAYDVPYKNTKNGHASGGALTMLWHSKVGAIITASMNQYQLFEADNMQTSALPSMCLTPRLEFTYDNDLFTNLSDFDALIDLIDDKTVKVKAKLVNQNQQSPSTGEILCDFIYHIEENKVTIDYQIYSDQDHDDFRYIFPIISNSSESYDKTDSVIRVYRQQFRLKLASIKDFTVAERVFNFVPGFEAIPLIFKGKEGSISIEVL